MPGDRTRAGRLQWTQRRPRVYWQGIPAMVTASSIAIGRTQELKPLESECRHWRWDSPQRFECDSDRVELSAHARWMRELAQLPAGRLERVAQVRAQIAAGTYETPGKVDAAIERMAADVLAK